MQKKTLIIILFFSFSLNYSQDKIDNLVFEIISKVSKDNLEKDIISLANFGTRHTLSDTISNTRGIGAARRWIKDEFVKISNECGGCLEVFFQKNYFEVSSNFQFYLTLRFRIFGQNFSTFVSVQSLCSAAKNDIYKKVS